VQLCKDAEIHKTEITIPVSIILGSVWQTEALKTSDAKLFRREV